MVILVEEKLGQLEETQVNGFESVLNAVSGMLPKNKLKSINSFMEDNKKYLEKKGGYINRQEKIFCNQGRIYKGKGDTFSVNGRDIKEYFSIPSIQHTIVALHLI